MTTIAYRAGVLAGDRATCSGGIRDGQATKVFRRCSDGALIGVAGQAMLGMAFARWFLAGEQGNRPSLGDDDDYNTGALIVRADGSVEEHDRFGWIPIEAEFAAIGTGTALAIGAMAAGAGAERAVQIACEYDKSSGCGVDVVRLAPARDAQAA